MRTLGILVAALALSSRDAAPQEDLVRLGTEAYIFGYPLVLMGLTEEVWLARGSLNQFDHLRKFPDYTFRTVVRPNADTLYSSAWFDVGKEPVILSVPDTKGRYYLMQFMDAWTNTFAVPGTRTTGNGAGQFAIVGPNWKGQLPPGITAFHSSTSMVWLIGRIQTNTASDYPFVHGLQDRFHLTPLSDWGKPPKPIPPPGEPDRTGRTPKAEIDQMDAAAFFGRLCRLMKNNPPSSADAPLVHRLARIGIEPGKDFDFARLGKETQAALVQTVVEGRKSLAKPPAGGTTVNGWNLRFDIGKYGVDYLLRAAVARGGLGANLPEDAVYPGGVADADGQPFTGAKRYVLHFDKTQLPPVKAFWSLTIYDIKGYFTENPIGRYAIGDRDKLRYNPDGSLDLYIQHARPSTGKESNWLPVPAEPFTISLRLYWPKPDVLKGAWAPPPIRRVE